jgi:predicted CoA-binding protein
VEVQRCFEVVDIFRRPQEVLAIVQEAVQIRRSFGKPLVIWMQLGIVNPKAAGVARKAGMTVIMDRCMKIEHHHLLS